MHGSESYSFCPICGGSFESRVLKQGEPPRLVCTSCLTPHYLDPKVAACTISEWDGKIVLIRRDIQPQKNKWVIPGGFVDRGETVEGAALRETLEECGLEVRIKNLLGVYSYPGEAVVIVVYVAEHVSGNLYAGDETSEARLVTPSEIPWEELAFRSTHDALKDYLEKIRAR